MWQRAFERGVESDDEREVGPRVEGMMVPNRFLGFIRRIFDSPHWNLLLHVSFPLSARWTV